MIRERLEADPDNNDLFDIEEFLTRKGGKISWRNWKSNLKRIKQVSEQQLTYLFDRNHFQF